MNADGYLVRSDEPDFYAGTTRDGQQVLMGLQSFDELIAIFFDKSGRQVAHEIRKLSEEPHIVGSNPYDPALVAKVDHTLRQWWREMGFTPETIRIQKFECEGNRIEELPEHYKDFLADPASVEPNRAEWPRWRALIESWKRRGMFVLWWGKDYWMDAEGTVDST